MAAGSAPARSTHRQGCPAVRTVVRTGVRSLLALGLATGATHGAGQDFHYVEPGVAACPAAPAQAAAEPKTVVRGQPLPGRLGVTCGFDQGSYTVTLTSTDPKAVLVPRSFVVNFGRLVGDGRYVVTFSTLGVQRISTSITANMGSPAVRGRFASRSDTFDVVGP